MKKFTLLAGMLILFSMSSQMILAQSKSSEKFKYISPQPMSRCVNPEQTIAVRHGEVFDKAFIDIHLFDVKGSKSGKIQGHLKISMDGRTLIFQPETSFILGEKIFVEINEGLKTISGMYLSGLDFEFTVQIHDNAKMLEYYYQSEYIEKLSVIGEKESEKVCSSKSFKLSNNYPEDFPAPYVTELDNPSEGYILATLRIAQSPIYNNYLAILDKYGVPVYYRKASDTPNDFKTVPGNKLAFCNFNSNDIPNNAYYLMDQQFNVIDTLKMGNGYYVDQHDLLMLENGDRIMMAYDPQFIDMSQIVPGGDTNAKVIGLVIQKLDMEDNVTFQWRSWDYLEITDAVDMDLTADIIDYSHGNAFELDDDESTLLISSRNMNEITKIDLGTGDIIWRLGLNSNNNEFTFIDDTIGFCRQHDIRVLPNGNITLYDNGNCHNPPSSQPLEYSLDLDNMTATLVWNYINDPAVYGGATGSNRRHVDGNRLICWGFTWPIGITEVKPDGSKTWELNVVDRGFNYRAVKSSWETDLFQLSEDMVDFGTYEDFMPWPQIILITNNSDQDIEISSTHNYLNSYQVTTQLPLSIPAGETVNFLFQLFPTEEKGQLDDVLTLNYDSFVSDSLPQRIAKQIKLTAYVMDDNPPEVSISPEDGTINAPLDTQLIISFNESVTKANGNTLKSSDIPSIIEFKKNDATGDPVEYSAYIDAWKRQIVITPELDSKQQYFVNLIENTVSDNDGNILTSAISCTFNTADVEPPVVAFFPQDSAVDVKRDVVVSLSFDEKIYKLNGDEIMDEDLPEMLLFKENDTLGPDVAYNATINDNKTEIYIMPDDDLGEYQQYYSVLFGNKIQDDVGNIINNYQAITFTTGEEFGIVDNDWNNQLRIMPNPNNGIFSLDFNNSDTKEILIYNLEGSLVYKAKQLKEISYEIDIQDLPKGIYIVKVKNVINNSIVEIKTVKY